MVAMVHKCHRSWLLRSIHHILMVAMNHACQYVMVNILHTPYVKIALGYTYHMTCLYFSTYFRCLILVAIDHTSYVPVAMDNTVIYVMVTICIIHQCYLFLRTLLWFISMILLAVHTYTSCSHNCCYSSHIIGVVVMVLHMSDFSTAMASIIQLCHMARFL